MHTTKTQSAVAAAATRTAEPLEQACDYTRLFAWFWLLTLTAIVLFGLRGFRVMVFSEAQ